MDVSSISISIPSLGNSDSEDATKLQNLNTLGAILLGIFTIVSFVGNIFLLSTVASSYQLRQSIFNYFLVNISLVNLIDTAVNLVLSMLYVSTGQWQLGRAACIINSFFQQLVLIETLIAAVLLCVDRAIALQSIHRYEDRLTTLRSILILSCVWAIGAIVSLPILAGAMWSEPNRYRYFCCNYANNPMGYPISIVAICFLIPLFVSFLSLGAIFWRAHEERLKRRSMLPERLADYTDFIVDNRRVQKHMELSKYAVVTFLIYFLLQGPYVVLNFLGQIRNSQELTNGGHNVMLITGDAETAITWLKTLFPVCFPFLTFCLCKDIWRKFKDLICCRRTNVIAANAFSSTLAAADVAALAAAGGALGVTSGHQYFGGGTGTGYGGYYGNKEMANVVTIVPTSAGIHQIRPGNDRCEYEYADVPQLASMSRRRSRDSHQQRRGNVRPLSGGGRTSDYDSDSSDTLSAAAVAVPDPPQYDASIQYRKGGQRTRGSHTRNESTSDPVQPLEIDQSNDYPGNQADQPIATPSAVDTGPHKFDPDPTKLRIIDDLQVSITKSSQSISDQSAEWPTIFRPKSSPSNSDPSVAQLSATNLKHQQVNPGVVPSPEKSGPGSRKQQRSTSQNQEMQSDEKRRPSLDEKLKLLFQDLPTNDGKLSPHVEEPLKVMASDNLSVNRHLHLPPLNMELNDHQGQQSPKRKISMSDKGENAGADNLSAHSKTNKDNRTEDRVNQRNIPNLPTN